MKRGKPACAGQVGVEVVLLMAAVASLLTVPLPGAEAQGRTAAVFLAESIGAFFQTLTFFVSLP